MTSVLRSLLSVRGTSTHGPELSARRRRTEPPLPRLNADLSGIATARSRIYNSKRLNILHQNDDGDAKARRPRVGDAEERCRGVEEPQRGPASRSPTPASARSRRGRACCRGPRAADPRSLSVDRRQSRQQALDRHAAAPPRPRPSLCDAVERHRVGRSRTRRSRPPERLEIARRIRGAAPRSCASDRT